VALLRTLTQQRAELEEEWNRWAPTAAAADVSAETSSLRTEVTQSWRRSLHTVDPGCTQAPSLDDVVLDLSSAWNRSHPAVMISVRALVTAVETMLRAAAPDPTRGVRLECLCVARLLREGRPVPLPPRQESARQLLAEQTRILLMPGRVHRVAITDPARIVLRRLIEQNGPVLFHQSGACCDGSSPMCFPVREFRIGAADVLLGRLRWHTEFWISGDRYELWKHTHLTVDVVNGRGSGFSLEAPDGVRFIIRSRLLTDDESTVLTAGPPPHTGADRMT
jgi:uncharacterized protein (DUF779 family)